MGDQGEAWHAGVEALRGGGSDALLITKLGRTANTVEDDPHHARRSDGINDSPPA